MRSVQRLGLASLILGAFTVAGCGADTPEAVAQEQSAVLKEFVSVLKTIKDKDTAAAAKTKLLGMGDTIKALNERAKAFTDTQKQQMRTKLEQEMKPMMEEFMGEMMRVAMLGPEVQQEMEGVEKVFKDMD